MADLGFSESKGRCGQSNLATRTPTSAPPPPPVIQTPSFPPATPNTDEYELAKMMWWEERSEGYVAMLAAGWTVANRILAGGGDMQTVLSTAGRYQGYLKHKADDINAAVGSNPQNKDTWNFAVQYAPDVKNRRGIDYAEGWSYFANDQAIIVADETNPANNKYLNALPTMKNCQKLWGDQGVTFNYKQVSFGSNAMYVHTHSLVKFFPPSFDCRDSVGPTPTPKP